MYQLAASIMCASQMNLKKELEELEKAKISLLHCDVMDGVFVNNLAMGPYVLEEIKANTKIPLDIHLATIKPAKIPNPPWVGITVLCTLRSSGSSKSFFDLSICMITGMAKKVIKNARAALSKILSMRKFQFWPGLPDKSI